MSGAGGARTLGAALVTLVLTTPAAAQPDPSPRPRFEAGAGLVLAGGVDFGRTSADLTANEPSAPSLPLFHAETALDSGLGVEGRLAWLMTRRLAAEAGLSWVRQTLETRITDDTEGAADTSATQEVDSYVVAGALVIHLPEGSFAGGKGLPFVSAGGGYVRQLGDESRLLGTGGVFHAGGGLKYFFSRPGQRPVRGAGVRLDASIEVRAGGFEIDPDRSSRTTWRLGAAGLFRF